MPTVRSHVAVEAVRTLRAEILRPGLPAALSVYPGDDEPDTVHVAVSDGLGGPVLAVGTLLPEPPPAWLAEGQVAPAPATAERWWRIRGMATAEGRRGQGLGRQVLDGLLEAAARGGGGVVWCHARVPALDFYLRAGFEPVSEVFEEPLIGPHRTMRRRVPPADHAVRPRSLTTPP